MSFQDRGFSSISQAPRWILVSVVVVLGLAWRLFLMSRYYGWEESDYGNLAMAQGVLSSRFTAFDMNHLPMYYALSAAVLSVVGDSMLATRLVALAGGLTTLGAAVVLSDRLLGRGAALLTAALLVFQPEFALYASSSLREPLYGAFLLGAILALGREHLLWAGSLAAMAFLTRMDALIILGPILALHALGRSPRSGRLLRALLPLALAVLLWSAYCAYAHGTWRFWGHSVEVNIETGLGAEAPGRLEWLYSGLLVVLQLATGLLPGHVGMLVVLAAIPGVVYLLREGFGAARCVALGLLCTTAFWLGVAFLAQHEPGHNLYWKWLYPLVPFWVIAGSEGLSSFTGFLRRIAGAPAAGVFVALALVSILAPQLRETQRQVELSETLYRPQLELARSIEQEIPEQVPLLLDNIPGCYLNRRLHERALWTWMDVPSTPGDPQAFAEFLEHEKIGFVLWFREEWTQAPHVAPFLSMGGRVQAGAFVLQELARENEYGWIWYRVEEAPESDRPPLTSDREKLE